VLSAMEADLAAMTIPIRPSENVPSQATGWRVPTRLGPLPPDLVERARQILANQQAVTLRLEAERSIVGQHLAAVRAVPAMRGKKQAVYLDVTG
jgi:hypothetical protein